MEGSMTTHELTAVLNDLVLWCKSLLHQVQGSLSAEQYRFIGVIHDNAKRFRRLVHDLPDEAHVRGEIVAGMVHEYRTPLASMLGCSMILNDHPEMLSETPVTSEQRELFARIHQAVVSLRESVESALQTGKEDAYQRAKQPAEFFRLSEMAETLLPVVRFMLRNQPVRLYVKIAGGLPPVYGFAYATHLVTRSMILSAAECIGQGDITLKIGMNSDADIVPQICVLYNGDKPASGCLEHLNIPARVTEQGSRFFSQQTGDGMLIGITMPLSP